MMSTPQEPMTVVEFATQHADECTCGTERVEHITTHVDLLIESAVLHGAKLWRVGADPEGRISLIWVAKSEEVWRDLLAQALEVLALKRMFGLDS